MFVALGVAIASTMLVVKGLEEHAVDRPGDRADPRDDGGRGSAVDPAARGADRRRDRPRRRRPASSAARSRGSAGSSSRWSSPACSSCRARSARSRGFGRSEPLLVASLAICFAMVWLAVRAGYSIALGAFVGGMLIAESGKGHEVDALVRPFRDIVRGDLLRVDRHDDRAGARSRRTGSPAVVVAVVLVVGKTTRRVDRRVPDRHGLAPLGRRPGSRCRRSASSRSSSSAVGIAAGVARPFLLPVVVGASCITAITGVVADPRAPARAASWLDAHLPEADRDVRVVLRVVDHAAAIERRDRGSIWARIRRPRSSSSSTP